MERKDLLLDENYNLQTANGDLVAGESDEQHVKLLVESSPCMFKEFPATGAGIMKYVKSLEANARKIRRDISVQLEADGYKLTDYSRDENGEYQINYKPTY